MSLDEIKKKGATCKGLLEGFELGDSIHVQWQERCVDKESYKTDGVIIQVTESVIHYRCRAGYMCSVSKNQIASGVKVIITQKAKIA